MIWSFRFLTQPEFKSCLRQVSFQNMTSRNSPDERQVVNSSSVFLLHLWIKWNPLNSWFEATVVKFDEESCLWLGECLDLESVTLFEQQTKKTSASFCHIFCSEFCEIKRWKDVRVTVHDFTCSLRDMELKYLLSQRFMRACKSTSCENSRKRKRSWESFSFSNLQIFFALCLRLCIISWWFE